MKKCIIILFLFSFNGCSENSEALIQGPKLNISKTVDVLVDLHLLEAHISTLRINQHLIKDSLHHFNHKIFENHSVSSENFNTSMQFYSQRPKLLDSIYSIIKSRLMLMNEKLPHIDEDAYKITPLSRKQIIDILIQTPYFSTYNDSSFKSLEKIKDSIYQFLNNRDSLLKAINLHSFMFSFNRTCSNPNERKQVLTELNNILLNSKK